MKIKISESKLKQIINESVRKTLRESSEDYNRFGVWDLVEELKEYLGADDLINRICGRMDPMTLSKMLRDIKSVEIGDNDDEIVSESENMEGDFKKYYMLLSRLQQDCKYYLGHGNRHPNSLWAHDEQEQVDKMRELYNMLPEKPEWITLEDIDNYAEEMGVH